MAVEWYYSSNRQQKGPVSWAELRERATNGLLKPTDLVWHAGLKEWQKAGGQEDLFLAEEPAAATAVEEERLGAEADTEPRSRRPRVDDDDDRSPPRRVVDDADDSRDDSDDRPTRRRRAKPKGMSTGLKVGLVVGGVLLVLGLLGCGGIVAIIAVNRAGVIASYDCALAPNQQNDHVVQLAAGRQVQVTVFATSPMPNTDVDLFILQNNFPLMSDQSVGLNSLIVFNPRVTGPYTLRVRNLGPGPANCHVEVR